MRSVSLRRTLLYWLIPAYVAVAGVTTVFSWMSAKEMVDGFMNEQMAAFAHLFQGATHVGPIYESEKREGDYAVVLWGRDGKLLDASLPELPLDSSLAAGFTQLESHGQRWHVYTLPTAQGKVQTLQRFEFRRDAIAELSNRTLLSLLLLIPLSSLIVWTAVRESLRPLKNTTRSVAEQNERNFSTLPLTDVPEEIQPLVLSINSLLARLRESFATQQRFVQDAAHELRTPIAALSLQLQNLRTTLPQASATRIVAMEGGLHRAQRLVEQLLRLAREDAGPNISPTQSCSLQEQLKASITALMPLADKHGIDVGFQADNDYIVEAQLDALRSLLDNLLDNALRYSPPGGEVNVRLAAAEQGARVDILDEGPGIAPDQLPRVFDRFFRVLGTGGDGSGLGLAIARGAAERLHARIDLSNLSPRGLSASVHFLEARLSA